MVEAVIFDIDGTLVDSVDLHARCWSEAFRHFDKEVDPDAIRDQIGKGGDQLRPVFLDEEENERIGEQLEEYRSGLWRRRYLPRVHRFDRVPELFRRVLDDGKRVALASSAKANELDAYKRIAGIEDLVEEETSSGDVEKSKPHPDIFEAARAKLGNPPPGRVVIVGDTPWDGVAARRAGIPFVGVRTGGWPDEELRASSAVAVYRDLADLLDRYDDSPIARPGGYGIEAGAETP